MLTTPPYALLFTVGQAIEMKVLITLCCLAVFAAAFPHGAPDEACDSMVPSPEGHKSTPIQKRMPYDVSCRATGPNEVTSKFASQQLYNVTYPHEVKVTDQHGVRANRWLVLRVLAMDCMGSFNSIPYSDKTLSLATTASSPRQDTKEERQGPVISRLAVTAFPTIKSLGKISTKCSFI